jgi:hypothetical protein
LNLWPSVIGIIGKHSGTTSKPEPNPLRRTSHSNRHGCLATWRALQKSHLIAHMGVKQPLYSIREFIGFRHLVTNRGRGHVHRSLTRVFPQCLS